MAENGFKPEDHMTNIKGKEYLEVKWRLVWFRGEHPIDDGWGIRTAPEVIDDSKAIYRAQIVNPEGLVVAEGTKSETPSGFADYIEKAETGAIGRALAICGYGTQFCGAELDEGDRIVDSPVAQQTSRKRQVEPEAEDTWGKENADKFRAAAGEIGMPEEHWAGKLAAYKVSRLEDLPVSAKEPMDRWFYAQKKNREASDETEE